MCWKEEQRWTLLPFLLPIAEVASLLPPPRPPPQRSTGGARTAARAGIVLCITLFLPAQKMEHGLDEDVKLRHRHEGCGGFGRETTKLAHGVSYWSNDAGMAVLYTQGILPEVVFLMSSK